MSLADNTDIRQSQDRRDTRKSEPRGFLLTLVCIVIFLVLAALLFPPITHDGGRAVWLTGL